MSLPLPLPGAGSAQAEPAPIRASGRNAASLGRSALSIPGRRVDARHGDRNRQSLPAAVADEPAGHRQGVAVVATPAERHAPTGGGLAIGRVELDPAVAWKPGCEPGVGAVAGGLPGASAGVEIAHDVARGNADEAEAGH